MKRIIILTALLSMTSFAHADENVRGYYKSNGTYVQPYTRSTPDNSYNNNYDVKGNTNPTTGESGTSSRTWNDKTPEYNQKTYGNPSYESTPSYNYNSGNSGVYRKKY